MFRILLDGIEIEECDTIEEVKELLIENIKNDMEDDAYDEQSYSVYEDDEFYAYAEELVHIDMIEDEYKGDWNKSNHYIELIEQGTITREMVKDVLYAINKKAKSQRDIIRAYQGNSRYTEEVMNAVYIKREYYKMKDSILQYFPIVELHKNIYRENEEDEEIMSMLGVVDVYGYKAHTIITEQEAEELIKKGVKIEEAEVFNNKANEDELVNDRLIDLFMDKWSTITEEEVKNL